MNRDASCVTSVVDPGCHFGGNSFVVGSVITYIHAMVSQIGEIKQYPLRPTNGICEITVDSESLPSETRIVYVAVSSSQGSPCPKINLGVDAPEEYDS